MWFFFSLNESVLANAFPKCFAFNGQFGTKNGDGCQAVKSTSHTGSGKDINWVGISFLTGK